MNDEIDELSRLRLQNNTRQQRFYEINKNNVNAKRRAAYNAKKEITPKPVKIIIENPITDFMKCKTMSYNDAIYALEALQLKPATFSKYSGDVKRIVSLTTEPNLIKCFNNYHVLIPSINAAMKSDTEPYSINTKSAMTQVVLFLIDKLNLPITNEVKKYYVDNYELLKIKADDEVIEKQITNPIPTFADYIERTKIHFGPESKMYILALLYREVTLRDDYQLLIVSLIKNTEADVSKNYIVVNKQSVLTLIINQYKTSNKFGQIVIKLSPLLSRKIRKFIIMEGLICDDNNYLFGDTNLTSYVSKSNAEIGIEGSISLYRKMRISDLLATNPSAEQRHQLAFDMKHSSNIQKTYFRCNIGQDD